MQFSYSQNILGEGEVADAIYLSGYEICNKKERLAVYDEALCEQEKKLSLAVYKLHIMNEMRALLDAPFCMLTISSFFSSSSSCFKQHKSNLLEAKSMY